MATAYNLAWLIDQTQHILDSNPLQADVDFNRNRIVWALNEASAEELNIARSEANPLFFLRRYEFTWPSGEAHYAIENTPLEYAEVYRYLRLDGSEKRATYIDFEYRDAKTLWWRDYQGPNSDTEIRALYWPPANFLKDDEDEPDWIAPNYRWLLPWSAACILRTIAEDNAPAYFERRRDSYRFAWHKSVEARPENDVARVTPQDDTLNLEGTEWYYYSYDE